MITEREIQELKDRIRRLEETVARLERDAQYRDAGGSQYVLSSGDKARADATRARNAELSSNTGPRPIGGGVGNTEQSATAGLQKDSLNGKSMTASGVCNGDGTITVTISY